MLASRVAVLGAAVLFSTGGAGIKACSLSAWQVASFRSAFALLVIFAVVPGARRRWTAATVAPALAYASTMVLFVAANKLTTAASTIFLQSTAPLYMLLFGPLVLREPVRLRDVGFAFVFFAGLAAFASDADPAFASAPDPTRGNLLAALSGLSWALTVGGLRWSGRNQGEASGAVLVAGNAIAFSACLPLALPVGPTTPFDWGIVAYLGLVQVGLGYVLLGRGIRGVSALEASFLLLLEPVLNPVWAWWLHGEVPGVGTLVGGVTILFATTARTWMESRTVGIQRAS